jgi:cell wall-associated NlpC family hydrolase
MTATGSEAGICRVGVAPLRSEPGHGSEQVSQLLMGESFEIEERDSTGEWIRVRCLADGYQGWLRSWYGWQVAVAERSAWQRRATWRCARVHETVRAEPRRGATVVAVLPWGARLEESGRQSWSWREVMLPDGRSGYVPRRSLAAGSAPGGAPTGRRLLKTAAAFLGVSYLWGGRSSWGMDCSGLVQTVFAWHGVQLPRDATDQMSVLSRGRRRGRRRGLESARLGDLLFFGPDEKTATHVAISTGGQEFLHAQGEVRLSSLDPSSQLYENKLVSSFLGVSRRPIADPSGEGPGRETA